MNLSPTYSFKDVTEIPTQIFEGKKLLIFDIDNTLFYSETTKIRKDILSWFKSVNKKYSVICFSNSFSIGERKRKIESILGAKVFLSSEKKPSKKLFAQICESYDVQAQDVIVIGDFHFTDVLFANRNHATSILVRPFGGEKKLSLWLARKLENFMLSLFQLFGYKV